MNSTHISEPETLTSRAFVAGPHSGLETLAELMTVVTTAQQEALRISGLTSEMLMHKRKNATAGELAVLSITASASLRALGWRLSKRLSPTTPLTNGPARS